MRMRIQELGNEHKEAEAKLAEIHSEHMKAKVLSTNFFLR